MKNVKKRNLKTKLQKFMLSGGLLTALLFLSGCMRFDQETGAPDGFLSEIVYDYLIVPLDYALVYLGDFLGNYGLAIVVFTILFRLVLLPFTLRQQKGMIESQVKMSGVQPVTQEIQAEIKATDDPEEQQALNMELMEIYKENDISIGGQLTSGCLPLLIQMPIFVAMLQVLRRSEQIASASFLGMELGTRSIVLALLTGGVYLIQSRMMIKDMPEDQQKSAGMTSYMSPIMMLMIGFSSPAGISLYWLISGVFSLGQQMFNQYYYKPKIEEEVRGKVGEVKTIERKKKPKPAKPAPAKTNTESRNSNNQNGRNRNAGKQQRRSK